jgi:hypothetical protein
MHRDEHYGAKGSTAALLAAYALWFLTAGFSFAICVTWHRALTHLYVALGGYKYGLTAYTYAVITLLILAWLVLIVAAESWYRHGAERGILLRRGGTMLGALVALLVIGMVLDRVG